MNLPAPILLVEDDEDLRESLRSTLEDARYRVLPAATGRAALDLVTDGQMTTPALILLDLNLPIIGGWELLAVLRCYSRLANIPVVVMTGEPVDHGSHGRVEAILKKPVTPEQILEEVSRRIAVTARPPPEEP